MAFSDKHRAEMEQLFRTLQKKRTGFFYLRHVAAVLLVCVVLAGASVMSVDAWRIKFLNFFTKVTQTNTEIRYNKEEPQGNSYSTEMVTLGYFPKDTKLKREVLKNDILTLDFGNDSYTFKLRVARANYVQYLDTEEKETEKVDISGATGILRITEDGYSTLKWSTETYSYTLSGNLDRETLLKIAENIS